MTTTLQVFRTSLLLLTLGACSHREAPPDGAPGGSGPGYFGPPLDTTPDDTDAENPWLGGGGASGDGGGKTGPSAGGAHGLPDPVTTPPTTVVLSRYDETPSGAKYLEITQTEGEASVALCFLEVYANGKTDPYRHIPLFLTGAGQVQLLCTLGTATEACNPLLGPSSFNGNDTLIVRCAERITDSFGQLGFDPGTAWTGGGLSSKDQNLLRCGTTGDTDPSDAFVIEAEWVHPGAAETPEQARQRCPETVGAGGATGF